MDNNQYNQYNQQYDTSLPNIQPYTVEQVPTYYDQPVVEQTTVVEEKPKIPIPFIILGVLVVLGLLAFLYLLLTSGGNNQNNNNNGNLTGTDPNKNVVLQWWGVFMDPEVVQPLIDEYQELHPNVTIEYANKWPLGMAYSEAAADYQSELNRVVGGGDPVQIPDIFMVQNSWAGDYMPHAQTSTTYTAAEFAEIFYPAPNEDFVRNGGVYGVPMWMDTLAIIYNKDLLAQTDSSATPPESWVEFRNFAKTLTEKEGNNFIQSGFAGGTPVNTTFSFELFNILMLQNGVEIVDEQGVVVFSADPESVGAFNFYKSFATGSNQTWSVDFKNEAAAFLEEDVAMITASSWRYRDILKYNEEYEIGLNIDEAPIPQLEGQTQEFVNFASYWGNMVSNDRPNGAYAWEFLEWLNEPEQLRKLSDNVEEREGYFGLLYARQDMADDLKADSYLQEYNEALPFAETWFMVKGREVQELFIDLLNQANTSTSDLAQLEEAIETLRAQGGVLTQSQ